ncbi:hypothetical protein A4X13_0g4096 [Tilletia indica]|uniref:Uncharacterized protein n=1 Tax=Tilletia indica TaxID=43049 RepID=A0A8T8SY43_9BASI|nr:hypothetical protein A4X13_0g4096 [Tilletia indica]
MAPSALATTTGLAYGGYTIQLPISGKYIGRADFETAIYAPKPIIVRETPYVWTVQPITTKSGKKQYNLIAGSAAAGRWTAQGEKVYSFVAPVDGQKAATSLILEQGTKKGSYYIKQANETVAGDIKSGGWYVHKTDEFSPVFAGGKSSSKAVAFRFVEQIAIEGPGGIARSDVPGPVQVEIV